MVSDATTQARSDTSLTKLPIKVQIQGVETGLGRTDPARCKGSAWRH
jgi:hypothetical protein